MANRLILLFSVFLLFTAVGRAQETTVSPYSIFGIGDLQLGESGRTAGMAGTALGLSGGKFLNTANPAALTGLDSITFLFDFSLSARNSSFTTGNKTQKSFGANFSKLTMGTRIAPFWSAALSLQPYSVVSYKVEKEGYIEGSSEKITTLFEGSGGISRFSFLNSIKLSKNFSLGADVMLLFGKINKLTSQSNIDLEETSRTTSVTFNLGMQYVGRLNSNVFLGAGMIYGYGGMLDFKNYIQAVNASGAVIYKKNIPSSAFRIPQTFGGGVSVIGQRLTLLADYRYQPWSVTGDDARQVDFTDTHKFDAGVAFTPAKGSIKSYFELVQYQAGVTISNSYLTMNGINPVNFEITAGAGFPFQGGSQLNVALGWGKKGSLDKGLIREDYLRLTLSLSIAENWFMKRLYN